MKRRSFPVTGATKSARPAAAVRRLRNREATGYDLGSVDFVSDFARAANSVLLT